uniref:Uncharacterized protein n=1 Tax=Arundo donax TaxID=35708 RepID=A0A0A9CYC4_ARUDO
MLSAVADGDGGRCGWEWSARVGERVHTPPSMSTWLPPLPPVAGSWICRVVAAEERGRRYSATWICGGERWEHW